MPNHVINELVFEPCVVDGDKKSDEERISELLKSIARTESLYENDKGALGVGTIDFNKIIPMPDNIFRGNLGNTERALYGADNWYDWSCQNWGTKWNAYDFDLENRRENELNFFTAWSSPLPVVEALAKKFSDFSITFRSQSEDFGAPYVYRRYEKGELVDDGEALFESDEDEETAKYELWGWDKELLDEDENG